MKVKDLPRPRPDRSFRGGILLARQPLLLCPVCRNEYSANPSDYWAANPETVIRCCDVPCLLVDKREVFTEVS